MFADRLAGSRLFARILGFELACPLCGFVYRINLLTKPGIYNQRTGIFHCTTCHAMYGVGVLLYPLKKPPRPPQHTPAGSSRRSRSGIHRPSHQAADDWTPNLREALALRNYIAWGILSPHAIHRTAARNYCLRHGCTCDLTTAPAIVPAADCPVHTGPPPAPVVG